MEKISPVLTDFLRINALIICLMEHSLHDEVPGVFMSRKSLIKTADFPYHVSARSNNKEWFYVPTDELWELCIQKALIITRDYNARIAAFVLMNNHYHMIIETPLSNIHHIMNYFQREIAKSINRTTGRINHLFGGSYKGTLISDERYFTHVFRYVYSNPVRAGLCSRVQDWPFSTLNQFLDNSADCFPIHPSEKFFAFKQQPELLNWLNTPYNETERESFKRALQKTEFSVSSRSDRGKFSPFA
jgi:REP element-mobilizing transposase RayT